MVKTLEGKSVLVTGGTGTLGKALIDGMIAGNWGQPERIVVFSRDEAKQHEMREALLNARMATDDLIYEDFKTGVKFWIGDVRNISDLGRALDGIDVVIHAAALKQVPSCEYFPEQAIATNCIGAVNLVEAIRASRNNVEIVVGLSTDKACQPINVMGMSKALQERIFIGANLVSDRTRFVSVRYGNIAASRGSVIPLFLEQIRTGAPITLTSREMTRFLMPPSAAVDTIHTAITDARRGEIVVKTAAAVKLINVIEALSNGREIPIKITGVRPGEKLYETLITAEEYARTKHIGDYFFLEPMLPELATGRDQEDAHALTEAFSSREDVLSLDETKALLRSWKII